VSATLVHSAPAEAPAPAARHAYRPDIDGLRALAILSVVLHHAGVPFIPGGFTGVDIFFVISGYLIGGQIYADIRLGSFTYLRFYQRRARRILPAFYSVLLFSIAAALILLSPDELRMFARDAFAATLSASNISFWRFANYFDPRSNLNPLLMTWSLGVEEQFYLVIPLLMVLLARLRSRLVLPVLLIVCALSLLLAVRVVSLAPMQAFYLLPDRAWELGLGVALAVFQQGRRPSPRLSMPIRPRAPSILRKFEEMTRDGWDATELSPLITNLLAFTGLALILAPLFLLTPQSPFPGLAAIPSVLGTTILIALPPSFVNRRLLALAPFVFIGQVSYSWYLWHWPLLAFLRVATADVLPLPAALIAVAIAFVLAVLSWRFIEQPFRHSTTPAAPLLKCYAVASLALLAVCAALFVAHGLPQRYPDLARIESPAHALAADPCLAASQDTPNLTLACYPSGTSQSAQTPIIALWGDSHAAALAPALRDLASTRGYAFAELAKNSCTPLIGATHFIPRLPGFAAACRRFNRATLSLIQSDPRIRIVVLTASWSAPLERTWMDGWLVPDLSFEPVPDSSPASASNAPPGPQANLRLYQSALAATVRALQSAGKQVILVQDTPSFAVDPLMLVRTARIPARRALALMLSPQGPVDLSVPYTSNQPTGPHSASVPSAQLDPGYTLPESSPAIAASQSLLIQESQQLSVSLFDPKPALCNAPTQCAYRDGETLLFIDSTHLSAAGATRALASFPLRPAQSTTRPNPH